MKKTLVILFLSLNLISLASAENNTWNISTWTVLTWEIVENNTWTVLEVTSATSWTKNVLKENPIESTMITYYYWETCPYCQQLNKYLTEVDWYNKLNIDKREVWNNKENALKMTEDLKRLGLENAKTWVPFLVVNENWKEKVLNWLDEAMAYFEPKLGKVVVTKVEQKDNKNAIIFMIVVAILAVVIPFAIINMKK